MIGDRGDMAVETLLKIVLALAAIWLVIAVLRLALKTFFGILGLLYALTPLIGLAIVVLIVLWMLDRI